MTQIITGLHIDVPSDELKTLLLGRLKYHQDKAAAYTVNAAKMREIDKELGQDAEQISKVSNSRNPTSELEQAVKKHKDQAVYYDFMAKHVIANSTYRLDETALVRLGIQADRFF